jgi:hypothetical protein
MNLEAATLSLFASPSILETPRHRHLCNAFRRTMFRIIAVPEFFGWKVDVWTQFNLLRRRIGDDWRKWLPEQKTHLRDQIRPMIEFYDQLAGKGDDLA